MTLVYLGGPIDLVNENDRIQWRKGMADVLLNTYGISTFDPAAAFNVELRDYQVSRQLVHINEVALSTCDFAVFVMSPNQPSIGTPIELMLAHKQLKPNVVIWGGDPEKPLPAYVSALAGNVVYTTEQAINAVVRWRNLRLVEKE